MSDINEKSLSEIIRTLVEDNERFDRIFRVFEIWPLVSGPQLSAVTTPKSLKNGTLSIMTTSSSAKALVLMRKAELLEKIRKMLPDIEINEIKVVRGY